MSTRAWLFMGALAVGAAATLLPAHDAFAKKGGPAFAGKFKGKFKAAAPGFAGTGYTHTGDYVFIQGLELHVGIGHGSVKWATLTIPSGAPIDFATATYPMPISGCHGSFSKGSFKGFTPPDAQDLPSWAGDGTMTITLKGFSNGRLSASFEGDMPPGDNNPNGKTIHAKGALSLDPL